ncbi:MAG: hypothetical protein NT105_07905 [Verrucomicrobia bacterium]|nr:hypothetical protein [Verrucomicrobiota bacterium]
MAANITPRNRELLFAEAIGLAGGLKEFGTALGITLTNEKEMRAAADRLVTTESEAGKAKLAFREAARAVQRADADAAKFLAAARAVLTIFLGKRWSAHWEPTGFPDQSTKVPRTQNKRRELCASLQLYFASQPAHEITAAGVTAAEADARHKALQAAHAVLGRTTTALGQSLKARDDAKQKLRRLVYAVKDHLKMYLPADDPRWNSFHLNHPATRTRPDPVGVVTLTQSGPGALRASWRRARRATRYRPLVQVVGVDTEPIPRNTVHDLFATLDGFTAGQTVRVQIIAANEAGEAKPSEAAEMVIE